MKLVRKEWEHFCSEIRSSRCVTVSELQKLGQTDNWIAIKHDVETDVESALKIAQIEARFGIRATFFVQSDLLTGGGHKLRQIAKLGHEVTYHYDVLDSNKGDYGAAIQEFSDTIKKFKELGFLVSSVCPHGNPMMSRNGWRSNKDFFRNPSVVSKFPDVFDLVVQGGQKISREYLYVSDAGYGFRIIGDIAGDDGKVTKNIEVKKMVDLIDMVNNSPAIVLSTHPHRWKQTALCAKFARLRFLILRRVAIVLGRSSFLRRIMSSFYFLAKKI